MPCHSVTYSAQCIVHTRHDSERERGSETLSPFSSVCLCARIDQPLVSFSNLLYVSFSNEYLLPLKSKPSEKNCRALFASHWSFNLLSLGHTICEACMRAHTIRCDHVMSPIEFHSEFRTSCAMAKHFVRMPFFCLFFPFSLELDWTVLWICIIFATSLTLYTFVVAPSLPPFVRGANNLVCCAN